MKFGLKGIGKWFVLAAMVAAVQIFVVPRIPLAGWALTGVLVIGGALVAQKFKQLPIGHAMLLAGAMMAIGNVMGGLNIASANAQTSQAITYRQKADPVAGAFL